MTHTDQNTLPEAPVIERVRHETRRRQLSVKASERLTPNMVRLTLGGDDLSGFFSAAFDDHIKIILPGEGEEVIMREYTPRRFDGDKLELTVDFAVHEAGPVTQWALSAEPGDEIVVGGPRGSRVITGARRWLLVGDETALPAIGRRIEEAGADEGITVLAAIPGPEDEQHFDTRARLTTHWVYRPTDAAIDPAPLVAALADLEIAPGTFVWAAAEARVAKAIRTHLLDERGHPPVWLKASGYWVKGVADTKENFD